MTSAVLRMAKQVDAIQIGGGVKRMHCIPVLQPQTVAAHSYGVAWWCWLLAGRTPSVNLLMAALQHDVAEGGVGDIPSPTKQKLDKALVDALELQVLKEAGLPNFAADLTVEEALILQASDVLDLMQYCISETLLGNRNPALRTMFFNCRDSMKSLVKKASVDIKVSHDTYMIMSDAFTMTKNTWRSYERE